MQQNARPIRVVNKNGKYTLRYVVCDSFGEVLKVEEEVNFTDRNVRDLKLFVEKALESFNLPVLVVNSGNKKMLEG